MRNPFRLEQPAIVSFSGGLTSGMMLHEVVAAFGGELPPDVKVIFCNTGKERPETLDFVQACADRWAVPITWLEYTSWPMVGPRRVARNGRLESAFHRWFRVVDHATASRDGEPFEGLIRERNMLPNVVSRFCTVEMKIRTSQRFLKDLGWEQWTNAIGFRADEPHRVAKLNGTNRHGNEETCAPLADAGVRLADVRAFWAKQPFTLNLKPWEGNCDLCFLKGQKKIQQNLRDNPHLADWWVRMEEAGVRRGDLSNPLMAYFRKDRPPYRVQLQLAQRPGLFDGTDPEDDELSISCTCTD